MGVKFTDAKGFGDARPAGWYPVSLEKVEFGRSKASDNPQMVVVAQINEGDFLNGKFFDYLPWDPEIDGSVRTKEFLLAHGYDVDEELEGEEVANELVGKQCWVRVNRRMSKGTPDYPSKMENRVQQYASEDPGEDTPTKEDLAKLLAKDNAGKDDEVPAAIAAKKNQAAKGGKNGAAKRR